MQDMRNSRCIFYATFISCPFMWFIDCIFEIDLQLNNSFRRHTKYLQQEKRMQVKQLGWQWCIDSSLILTLVWSMVASSPCFLFHPGWRGSINWCLCGFWSPYPGKLFLYNFDSWISANAIMKTWSVYHDKDSAWSMGSSPWNYLFNLFN